MPKKNKTLKKFKKIAILSFAVFIFSVSFRLFVCNFFAIKNTELSDCFVKKGELEKEISSLTYDNSQLASLSVIEDKAKGLGFIEMKDLLIALDPFAPAKVASLTQ